LDFIGFPPESSNKQSPKNSPFVNKFFFPKQLFGRVIEPYLQGIINRNMEESKSDLELKMSVADFLGENFFFISVFSPS
jgi:hypothetical protein